MAITLLMFALLPVSNLSFWCTNTIWPLVQLDTGALFKMVTAQCNHCLPNWWTQTAQSGCVKSCTARFTEKQNVTLKNVYFFIHVISAAVRWALLPRATPLCTASAAPHLSPHHRRCRRPTPARRSPTSSPPEPSTQRLNRSDFSLPNTLKLAG